VTSSVVVVIDDGASVERLVRRAVAWAQAGRELVLVDRRGTLDADAGPPARVFEVPGASLATARAVGAAVARGSRVVVADERAGLSEELIDELLDDVPASVDVDERLDLFLAIQHGAVQPPDDVAEVVAQQAERLRDLLLVQPDLHGALVAGARSRGLVDLPWQVVNRGRAQNLAILHNFVPYIDTSGLVAARRLREWAVVTDVVCQDLSSTARSDPSSSRIVEEFIDQLRILPGAREAHTWSAGREFVHDVLAQVADLQAGGHDHHSLYSRAMPPASHIAAAVLKLRSPGLTWTAEFSDPLLMNAYGEARVSDVEDDALLAELADGLARRGFAVPGTRRYFAWAELVAYALADAIVFTNAHQRDFMLGYCADDALATRAREISTVQHHPVPDERMYQAVRSTYPLSDAHVHLGYFGNFYANRRLTEVLDAIDGLTLAERDRLRLHIFTSKPDTTAMWILERGDADVVSVRPMLGYLEFLNLTTRLDVLLINDYATSPHYVPNPYLPAKLADYLGSGSRIWALFEPGSVLSADERVAYATPLGDAEAALRVLRDILGG
jgi:hypothetical protein